MKLIQERLVRGGYRKRHQARVDMNGWVHLRERENECVCSCVCECMRMRLKDM